MVTTQAINIHGDSAFYMNWEGADCKVHFYGANGYSPGVYAPLFRSLHKTLDIESLLMRAQWPDIGKPAESLRWQTYADDLIYFLELRNTHPIIGMGHSMGATATVFAAAKRPDLFSELVLIEPAALPTKIAMWDPILPFSFRRRFLQPGKSTLKRRHCWPNRRDFREKCESWKTLQGFSKEALDAFASSAVIDTSKGVELAFPREWEAHNYFCPPSIWSNLKKVTCPVTVIRGESSEYFSDTMWSYWQRKRPQDNIIKLDGLGHLLPLQEPALCAATINHVLGGTILNLSSHFNLII